MEEFKYKVSIKKGYKVFFTIFSVSTFVCLVGCGVASIGMCNTIRDYFVVALVLFFLLSCSLLGVYQNMKSVHVYKGKIIYKTLLFEKEYKPTEIYCAKTEIVMTEGRVSHIEGGIRSAGTRDEVTTFYNKLGKKLFAFGLAYDNVSKLKNNVMNNRKSVDGSRK